MERTSFAHASVTGVILALLIMAVPVSAYNVALYGTNAGFDPTLHPDTFTVITSVPGSSGAGLDAAADNFTRSPVDIIILGGNASFSGSTATKIESAVASGKILLVAYPCNQFLNASLPSSNDGVIPGGGYLNITDPSASASGEIFRTLPDTYPVQGNAPDMELGVPKTGAEVLLSDNASHPVLLSWKYGKGTVIEWTTVPVPAYMNITVADTIMDRMLNRVAPAIAPVPSAVITQPATITPVVQTNGTSATDLSPVPTGTSGDISVFSSPPGASILIDGTYYGVTPTNLTGISQGNHLIRLTEAGYYDYEGSIYIVPGQTTHAFGTLPPLSQYSPTPTQAPAEVIPIIVTVAPTGTPQDKGVLDNSSVIVAIIGVITATIAAGATIFTHVFKGTKKE